MKTIELPHGEKFKEAWEMWLKDRKERRKPVTSRAAELQLGKLSKVPEQSAIEAIMKSIELGYQGIFIKEQDIIKPKVEKKADPLDRLREIHSLHRKGRVSDETYIKVHDWCFSKGMIILPENTISMLKEFYEGDKLKILTAKEWFDYLTATGKSI